MRTPEEQETIVLFSEVDQHVTIWSNAPRVQQILTPHYKPYEDDGHGMQWCIPKTKLIINGNKGIGLRIGNTRKPRAQDIK